MCRHICLRFYLLMNLLPGILIMRTIAFDHLPGLHKKLNCFFNFRFQILSCLNLLSTFSPARVIMRVTAFDHSSGLHKRMRTRIPGITPQKARAEEASTKKSSTSTYLPSTNKPSTFLTSTKKSSTSTYLPYTKKLSCIYLISILPPHFPP